MSVQMIIELSDQQGAQTVLHALELYKTRLRASIDRTRRRLADYERRYQVPTDHFLTEMTAEDLTGGDLEYVEWAGEAQMLTGLEAELAELEHAHYELKIRSAGTQAHVRRCSLLPNAHLLSGS